MGWNPAIPASARWLAADGFRGTRRDDAALTVDRYADAERACAEHVDRMSCSLPRWMPVPCTRDLDEMQETRRRDYGSATTRSDRPGGLPRARLGIPSDPFTD